MSLWNRLAYGLTIAPRLRRLKLQFPDAIIFPTGSRYVCDPAPITTDVDFLVYVPGRMSLVNSDLEFYGYQKSDWKEYHGSDKGEFTSWRRGPVNLIVTSSRKYALTFHTATHICKEYNVKSKYDRVLVHEWVSGNRPEWEGALLFEPLPVLGELLDSMTGPHGHAIHMAYRAKHGLMEEFL